MLQDICLKNIDWYIISGNQLHLLSMETNKRPAADSSDQEDKMKRATLEGADQGCLTEATVFIRCSDGEVVKMPRARSHFLDALAGIAVDAEVTADIPIDGPTAATIASFYAELVEQTRYDQLASLPLLALDKLIRAANMLDMPDLLRAGCKQLAVLIATAVAAVPSDPLDIVFGDHVEVSPAPPVNGLWDLKHVVAGLRDLELGLVDMVKGILCGSTEIRNPFKAALMVIHDEPGIMKLAAEVAGGIVETSFVTCSACKSAKKKIDSINGIAFADLQFAQNVLELDISTADVRDGSWRGNSIDLRTTPGYKTRLIVGRITKVLPPTRELTHEGHVGRMYLGNYFEHGEDSLYETTVSIEGLLTVNGTAQGVCFKASFSLNGRTEGQCCCDEGRNMYGCQQEPCSKGEGKKFSYGIFFSISFDDPSDILTAEEKRIFGSYESEYGPVEDDTQEDDGPEDYFYPDVSVSTSSPLLIGLLLLTKFESYRWDWHLCPPASLDTVK